MKKASCTEYLDFILLSLFLSIQPDFFLSLCQNFDFSLSAIFILSFCVFASNLLFYKDTCDFSIVVY